MSKSRLVAALLLALPLFLPLPSFAQSPAPAQGNLLAGSLLLRGRLIGIIPNHGGTPISPIGGNFDNDDVVTPEIDLSYFFTNHIAVEGETGFFRDKMTAENTAFGTFPVGHVWAAPVILVAQYHILPFARLNPYVGAGLAVVPYFGEQPAGGLVQQLHVDPEVAAVFQAGADLHVSGRWFGNFDVKKLVLDGAASANGGQITASGKLNPWVIGAGIGYRF